MLIDLFLGKINLLFFKKLLATCVVILVASFLGFMLETIWVALRHGYIDNRGMHLPFLLGYGLANLLIYLILGSPGAPRFLPLLRQGIDETGAFLLYFGEVFVFISVGEATMGHLVHRFCSVEWWNYNSLPLHIGQYTSVPTSVGFSACICIFLDKIFVPGINALMSTDLLQFSDGILFLMILAAGDCLSALLYMAKHKCPHRIFRLSMGPEGLKLEHEG